MSQRPGKEGTLQASIIQAVTWYFRLYTDIDLRFDQPTSGQQGTNLESGRGKPYDLGVFYDGSTVLLLEIKDRQDDDSFDEENELQQKTLKSLWNQGVEVWYAYNSWNWSENPAPQPAIVLGDTHALAPHDFSNPLAENGAPPATQLQDLLERAAGARRSNARLADLLERDPAAFDFVNNRTLIILVNIDEKKFKLLASASQLRFAKKYFDTHASQREKLLKRLNSIDDQFGLWLAKFMFHTRDISDGIAIRRDSPEEPGDDAPNDFEF
ncbi:hypothetical protein AB4Y45_44900 [Paraburkholderia sp. EG287A]|uniref:hypothetical protein n=1 Tax=unclassified Paraburkholderia TaxID=2615204 RepID=UPI0034D2B94F